MRNCMSTELMSQRTPLTKLEHCTIHIINAGQITTTTTTTTTTTVINKLLFVSTGVYDISEEDDTQVPVCVYVSRVCVRVCM